MSPSQPCDNDGCYCDQICHDWGDCCSDITAIGCLGKTKSKVYAIQ